MWSSPPSILDIPRLNYAGLNLTSSAITVVVTVHVQLHVTSSLSSLMTIFPGGRRVAGNRNPEYLHSGLIGAKDDGSGGDN